MKTSPKTTLLAALLISLLPIFCSAADRTQPTVEEQVLLERINAARVEQAEESRRLNLDFQEGMSYKVQPNLQPLIWRASLATSAVEHNADMWARGYFDHATPEGLTPFQQVHAHDADFLAAGQDLAAGRMFQTPDAVYTSWMIDAGIANRGHRQCILHSQIDTFGAQRSSTANSFYGTYWTAYFGVSLSQKHYVTGVIYRDLNRNGRYDEGEGMANWKVRLIAQSPEDSTPVSQPISNTPASAAVVTDEPAFVDAYVTGGYAVEIPAEGAYTVEAVAPDGQSYFSSADAGNVNVKVDFVIESSHAATAAAPVTVSGSSKHAGCELDATVTGRTSAAWTLLAGMGLLMALILGLRIGGR